MEEKHSLRRLTKDLKDLIEEQKREPIYNIAARPLEESLFVWHANLVGPVGTPYEGGVFHMEINFSEHYPMIAPSVRILTPIPHPHVIDNQICLDLLRDYESFFDSESDDYGRTQGTGWSSAYSVYTLLIQMQTFLVNFDDCSHITPPEISKMLSAIPQAIEDAALYSCENCPHKPNVPWPEVQMSPDEDFISSGEENSIEEYSEENEKEPIHHMEHLTCFHTKMDHTEVILGVGIIRETSVGNNFIRSLSSCFDWISFNAFAKLGVRHDASNKKFTHWLPLYVNEEHGNRALPYIKQGLSLIATGKLQTIFNPEWASLIFPKLLSGMTVDMMSDEIHTSHRALAVYCEFHRLFLLFAEKYPAVVTSADKKIQQFISDEKYRNKKEIPSLGEFLPLLTISKYTWDEIAEYYMTESLDRSVRWFVHDYPELRSSQHNPTIDATRAQRTFQGSIVGLRLLMFNVKFLDKIARPKGKSLKEIASEYDAKLGMPSEEQKQELKQLSDEARSLSSWEELYKTIRLPVPVKSELVSKLRRAVSNSRKKQYHSDKPCTRHLENKCSFGNGCKYNHAVNTSKKIYTKKRYLKPK